MNKYQNGKIYTLRSHQTEKIYIGSTIQPLSQRFHHHKSKCKITNISSKEIFKFDDAYIELLESYPCNNKEELNKREGELIRLNKEKCVNICIAGRSIHDYKVERVNCNVCNLEISRNCLKRHINNIHKN